MDEKDAFEKWLRTTGHVPTYTLDGEYSGFVVGELWECWRAAWKAAKEQP